MSLDRDELAARNMAALLGRDGHVGDAEAQRLAADVAVGCADALIARLAPAPWVGEPGKRMFADAAPRPEWVRLSGDFRLPLERKVVRWEGHQPVVMHSSGLSELAPLVGGDWEPCAAPAPSPAASPAAYVPKCGDVVALTVCDVTGDALPHRDSLGAHLYRVESDKPDHSEYFKCVRVDGRDTTSPCFISARGMRPATAAERVAAGLDAPAKPAFDETSEREAAVDIAKDRGLDVAEEVGFVAGWLARARIAANGGVA